VENLIHSIKLIASKILPNLPISGNVKFDDQWDPIENLIVDHAIRLPKIKQDEIDLEKGRYFEKSSELGLLQIQSAGEEYLK
jgi:hypothetical protein